MQERQSGRCRLKGSGGAKQSTGTPRQKLRNKIGQGQEAQSGGDGGAEAYMASAAQLR